MSGAVGIDLGTTHTLLGVCRRGQIRIVENAEGSRLTPSAVAFPEGRDPLVGAAALRWGETHPEDVVLSAKRAMGTDRALAAGANAVTPIEVSGHILREIAADAERALGHSIRDAVITVPAYFDGRARLDTVRAASLAGLRVLRILNEPTAAALAYGLEDDTPQTVVVWDLGGGTFDVSVLRMGRGVCEVVAVCGDNALGGDDWDRLLADHLQGALAGRGTAVEDTPAGRWRLRRIAADARCALSRLDRIAISVSEFGPPVGSAARAIDLDRRTLDALAAPLLDRLQAPTRQALADAGLSVWEIDRVLLAGGATRMPAVQELAARLFGIRPTIARDPDLQVAVGAALHAASLDDAQRRHTLLDVNPLTLGVEVEGGRSAPLIGRNAPLPAKADRLFTTVDSGQSSVHVHVVQGEDPLVANNTTLGRFDLGDLSGLARGAACVEISFELDESGILHVRAADLHTESSRRIEIVPIGSPAPAKGGAS